ncbi:MAG: bifunctional riboflavin kinase/FAD synthetase [Brevinematia bacterium]
MKIINSTKDFPFLSEVCLTIGNFDGFHIGHQKIIASMKLANKPSFVITFKRAPLEILNPQRFKGYIFPYGYKVKIFRQLGIDYLAMLDFNEIKDWTKEKFLDFLKSRFKVIHLFIGEDFRFGKGNEGDVTYLSKSLSNVEVVEKVKIGNVKVSSTLVRDLLSEGRIEEANEMLSRPYFITSYVERGDGIGSRIGFPTLNLKKNEQVILANGVYFTLYRLDEKVFPAMTYIGNRPTLGKREFRNETNIIEIGESTIQLIKKKKKHSILFIKRIRDEKRLHNLEELKNLLYNDRKVVLDLFKVYNEIGGLKDEFLG